MIADRPREVLEFDIQSHIDADLPLGYGRDKRIHAHSNQPSREKGYEALWKNAPLRKNLLNLDMDAKTRRLYQLLPVQ